VVEAGASGGKPDQLGKKKKKMGGGRKKKRGWAAAHHATRECGGYFLSPMSTRVILFDAIYTHRERVDALVLARVGQSPRVSQSSSFHPCKSPAAPTGQTVSSEVLASSPPRTLRPTVCLRLPRLRRGGHAVFLPPAPVTYRPPRSPSSRPSPNGPVHLSLAEGRRHA
jgi:hypothetical protein